MSHVLQIQAIAENQRRRAYQGAGSNSLAIIVEDYQRYIEYLDELEIAPLGKIDTGITVKVDGKQVRFENQADFENWLVEHIS